MSRETTLTGVTLGVTQTITVWSMLLPPITEIREHTPGRNPDFTDDMRQAELVAGTISLTIGYLMTKVTHNYEPLIYSALFLGVLITSYEYVLHSDTRHLSIIREKVDKA